MASFAREVWTDLPLVRSVRFRSTIISASVSKAASSRLTVHRSPGCPGTFVFRTDWTDDAARTLQQVIAMGAFRNAGMRNFDGMRWWNEEAE